MIQVGQLHVFLQSREIRSHGGAVQIGSRAFDIFELLIQARGALVSKEAIMREVWPDTVVQENNLQVHIAALRKALREDRDLIVTVPGRGYRLLGVRGEPPPAPGTAAGVPAAIPRSMPPSSSTLVGRQSSIDNIVAALDTARVVTLVGAGGIGKTRVALEVASRVRARFADGVAFVPLATASDPGSALGVLADSLGVALAERPVSLAAICAGLAGRHTLIVLDNCEHLIDMAAHMADAMTAANGTLHVLATSREALRIEQERLHQVPPLDVPGEDDGREGILRASAVQLFLARAQARDPRFELDDFGLALAALICRRLDGIPLAIELAAARAAVLGLDVLTAHLADHFSILSGGFRTALPRHQTLKAMLDWSYRLLDGAQRVLLRWLGVFANGFSFDAACEVLWEQGYSRAEVLDALEGLVSKSLVVREREGAPARYRLLEITRAYALQQLDDHGERKAAEHAYTRYLERRALRRELTSVPSEVWRHCEAIGAAIGEAMDEPAAYVPSLGIRQRSGEAGEPVRSGQ
ncbi:winged helix-turn-helix domain-containing protein [Trinickia caryophylli]|nr:transcriptional regulator [Trinickia caryophylli]TRX15363.1 transcriptional regulator [Trinickia caryophylli]